MSKDDTKGAYPLFYNIQGTAHVSYGLTKRELFAAMAMQGILSSEPPDEQYLSHLVAWWSVNCADELLAALEEKKGEK